MVSAAKSMQEEHGDTGSGRPRPLDNEVLSDTLKGSAISDQLNPEDEIIPKVRKPYTITKQRERWTEEEHKKFLEALKLYGRAWRKIEEHVGSKTAVQIRSHAQKFFSKITRETDAGEESTLRPIEIPPARPKRKPVHPYPRKMATLTKPGISSPEKLTRSLSANMSVSDHENQSSSPTSVLSAVGSDNTPNGSLSPVSSNIGVKHGGNKSLDDAENSSEDEQILDLLPQNKDESNGQFLKLFGKTLLVADPNPETCKPESIYKSESDNNNLLSPTRVVARKFSTTNSSECVSPDLPWLTLHSGVTLPAQEILSLKPIKAHLSCDKTGKIHDDKLNENSSDLSNEEKSRVVESCLEFKGQVKNLISSYKLSKRIAANSLKGFVPYKRCVMDRDSAVSTMENSDEREEKRIRVCS